MGQRYRPLLPESRKVRIIVCNQEREHIAIYRHPLTCIFRRISLRSGRQAASALLNALTFASSASLNVLTVAACREAPQAISRKLTPATIIYLDVGVFELLAKSISKPLMVSASTRR